MRIFGFAKPTKVDHFVTKEALDRQSSKRLQKFLEEIEMAIFSANREIVHKAIPDISRETVMKFAVRVAEARARYAKLGLDLSEAPHMPSPDDVAKLKAAREVYEELLHAFETTHRIIERGYADFRVR